MSINDKKGINLTSGFKYVGGQPLDVRLIAEDESDLQSLVDNGATYNGMVVWVNSTSKRMVFNGSEFIEDVNPNTIGNINDVLEQINGGGTSSGGSSSGGSSGSNNSAITINSLCDMFSGTITTKRDLTNEEVSLLNTIDENILCVQSFMNGKTGEPATSNTSLLVCFKCFISNITKMGDILLAINMGNGTSTFAIMQKDDGNGYEIMNITES